MKNEFELEKEQDDKTIERVFARRINSIGNARIVHQLSQKLRAKGCFVAASEEIDAMVGVSKMGDLRGEDAHRTKFVMRSFLTKSSSCAKIFDREWSEYFSDVKVGQHKGEGEKSKFGSYAESVKVFLNAIATHTNEKMVEKGTFIFDYEDITKKGEREIPLDEENSKKMADFAFEQCKPKLVQWEDATECLRIAGNEIQRFNESVINEGKWWDTQKIPVTNEKTLHHLHNHILNHFRSLR